MLKRRLIMLVILAAMVLAVIGARLAALEIFQHAHWRDEARSFTYRHYIIPTRRGEIMDRDGRLLAVETPCYNLAIQYQAMNHDAQWITMVAIRSLEQRHLSRSQIQARLSAEKRKINAELDRMPESIADHCGVSLGQVLHSFDIIRRRMQLLREDVWTLRYSHQLHGEGSPDDFDEQLGLANSINLSEAHVAHTVIPDISFAAAAYFKKHAQRYPGLVVESGIHRIYPYNSTGAHLIGYMRQVTAGVMERHPFELPRLIPGGLRDTRGQLKGYLPGDSMGATGVEQAAEKLLRGTRGVRLVNLEGHAVKADYRRPIPGQNVRLTLDIELQQALRRKLANPATGLLYFKGRIHNAAVVVLSVKHNRVLLMLSEPGYNNNTIHLDFQRLLQDSRLPLMDRALSSAYPPGSIVKPLEASLALTAGVITPDTILNCGACLFPNHPNIFRNWTYPDAPGLLGLSAAIEQSCDTYFYQVGMRMGLARLVAGYRSYGLGAPTGIGLAEETSGYLPSVRSSMSKIKQLDDAIMMGIGQGPLAVTPLQMANAFTAFLRGGIWMQPQLMEQFHRPPARRIPLNTAAFSGIYKGMYLVVHGPYGTAPVLNMSLPVEGKTGTAQAMEMIKENGKDTMVKGDDAWFAGCVPADAPKYVIVAIVEMGGDGGRRAGPIVKECIKLMQKRGYLPGAGKS
ncbi:MAG: penicillin-binding transpeptidase domain-containing protein [Planctomycetia bacterium]|nr:penicillin-binding transpeptidase domain-containing protein [Planctomycetia bacterium]